mmetsp:Transcript_10440/g.27182  ORF Transcript_10440/g.27182 Transcript_10440/m.27182 type:complete len:502 (+) Transcript_10440:2-1507(+)
MTNWSNQLWTMPGPDWKPPTRNALIERVSSQVDLANFQPSAILQGLVDTVVWLRSDFPLGQYNGPPPGHYRRIVGMPDYSVPVSEPDPIVGDGVRPLLAFFEVSGGSFSTYGRTIVHESRKQVLQPIEGGIPIERNTLWDSSWECKRPPVKDLSAFFYHSVVTLDQLLAPSPVGHALLDEVRSLLRADADVDENTTDWILDIDLDFFASYSPLLAFLIRKHGWLASSDAEAFAAWAVPLGQMCSQGLEPSTQQTLFSTDCQAATVRQLVRLPFTQDGRYAYPSAAVILQVFRDINSTCEIPEDLLSGLSCLICGLTEQQRLQWALLQADDWWWVMQAQGPHHYSSPEEITAQVGRLEQVLRQFSVPPSLVTIARSMDMYMPEGASDIAEWEVLLLLRRLWPATGAPELPTRLSACTRADAESILRHVTFFPTSRPLPGQQPGPLLPRPWPFDSALVFGAASPPDPAAVCEEAFGLEVIPLWGSDRVFGCRPLPDICYELVD